MQASTQAIMRVPKRDCSARLRNRSSPSCGKGDPTDFERLSGPTRLNGVSNSLVHVAAHAPPPLQSLDLGIERDCP